MHPIPAEFIIYGGNFQPKIDYGVPVPTPPPQEFSNVRNSISENDRQRCHRTKSTSTCINKNCINQYSKQSSVRRSNQKPSKMIFPPIYKTRPQDNSLSLIAGCVKFHKHKFRPVFSTCNTGSISVCNYSIWKPKILFTAIQQRGKHIKFKSHCILNTYMH